MEEKQVCWEGHSTCQLQMLWGGPSWERLSARAGAGVRESWESWAEGEEEEEEGRSVSWAGLGRRK